MGAVGTVAGGDPLGVTYGCSRYSGKRGIPWEWHMGAVDTVTGGDPLGVAYGCSRSGGRWEW